MSSQCCKCHRIIRDDYVYSVRGNILHKNCLQCEECHQYLEETCFARSGVYYCRKDFYSNFGPRCAGCDVVIQYDEMSTKIGHSYYHPQCVTCAVCNMNAQKGMNVGMSHNGQIYCEEHSFLCQTNKAGYEFCERDSGIESDLSTSESLKLEGHAGMTGEQLEGTDTKSPVSNEDADSDSEKKLSDADKNKRRGPRTTIKAKQLEILKNVFNQTPKPTRLMREQLAKETGLPMRVIQVWFQNKRSKEKRMHQMRFMARGPYLPPSVRGQTRFCFPPPNVGYPNQFDSFTPPHPEYGFSALTTLEYNHMNSETDPVHLFPSPPPQSPDYPSPPGFQYSPEPTCFPSPPLQAHDYANQTSAN